MIGLRCSLTHSEAKIAKLMMSRINKRTVWVVMVLLVTVLFWTAVGFLSRQPTLWAILTTHCLFGWMLLETGMAICIVVIAFARQKKVTAFRCIIVGLTLSAAVGLAE